MPSPLNRGMPWPLSRNVRPFWVPAGTMMRTRPKNVAKGKKHPSNSEHPTQEHPKKAELGARGHLEEDAALERGDGNLAPEQRLAQGHRHLPLEVVAATGERAMRPQLRDHDQVRAARALAGQLDPAARRGTARDRHLEPAPLELHDPARAVERLLQRQFGGDLDRGRAGALAGAAAQVRSGDGAGHAQPREELVDRLA